LYMCEFLLTPCQYIVELFAMSLCVLEKRL
jgi:hypothetical protein